MITHLWQSTVFAVLAAGLALVLRSHRAGIRYGIWLASSLKFLVPFALLAAEREPKANDGGYSWGRGRVVSRLAPLSDLAFVLSSVVGRPVVDRSGAGGKFDFTLLWTPENPPPAPPANRPVKEIEPPPDQNGPGLFTALQDQLGLRLNPSRGPVTYLVIDSAERPTEN